MDSKKPKKLAILLSTYNGENFILEQLESLTNIVTEYELNIHIRDDESTDGTCEIIKNYMLSHSNVFFYEGKNLGVIGSFLWLVNKVERYDYYAFCDQDDVWEPLKILAATNKMDSFMPETILAYCSAYTFVDEKLNFLGRFNTRSDLSVNNLLIENCAPGCTLVFNKALREKYLQLNITSLSEKIVMHDWFFLLLAKVFGFVIYDHNSYLLYRQHQCNVVGKKIGLAAIVRAKFKQIKKDYKKVRHPLSQQMEVLAQCLSKSENNKASIICEKFVSSQTNFLTRLKFIFGGHIKRVKKIDGVIFKILYVLGYFK